uniref:MHC class I-like antigen recognition-like domain-containing protein n=1 Tax=Sinocyclocheilus rhinocerous TaxID=307959 RepID=A0A673MK66_9TELE
IFPVPDNNSFSIEDFRIYTSFLLLLFIHLYCIYYIYKTLAIGFVQIADLPGIYDFTAMGLLDDRQIDYYNSTQSVQRRIGCEIDNQGHFPKAFMSSFMMESTFSFDIKESQWVTSFDAALPIKRKWDNVPILNQYTKGYLEKECVDWLKIFREFANKELRNGCDDRSKLKLICMATSFFKDVTLIIRKYCTSLPEDESESTGIRPNHDGTFQLKKSVEIQENEKAEYSYFVTHSSHFPGLIAAVIGGLLVLAVIALVVYILKKRDYW